VEAKAVDFKTTGTYNENIKNKRITK